MFKFYRNWQINRLARESSNLAALKIGLIGKNYQDSANHAITVLGEIGSDDAVLAIETIVKKYKQSMNHAVDTLKEIGSEVAVKKTGRIVIDDIIANKFNNLGSGTADKAISTASATADHAIDALKEIVDNSTSLNIVGEAIDQIGWIGNWQKDSANHAIDVLKEIVKSTTDVDIRERAIDRIGRIGEYKSNEDYAITALKEIGTQDVVIALGMIGRGGFDREVGNRRHSAISALEEIGSDEAAYQIRLIAEKRIANNLNERAINTSVDGLESHAIRSLHRIGSDVALNQIVILGRDIAFRFDLSKDSSAFNVTASALNIGLNRVERVLTSLLTSKSAQLSSESEVFGYLKGNIAELRDDLHRHYCSEPSSKAVPGDLTRLFERAQKIAPVQSPQEKSQHRALRNELLDIQAQPSV